MLIAAFVIFAFVVSLGTALAVLHLRATRSRRIPAPLTALHGLLALAGFVCLIFALRGPPRGLESGTASFGAIAAWLFGLALLAGIGVFAARRTKPGLAGLLIGVHATLAVSGLTVLAAYLFAG